MNRTTLLLLVAALAALPTVNAGPAVPMPTQDVRCPMNPGYLVNEAVCDDDRRGQTCAGTQVFVLSSNECQATEGAGCDGIQVFLMSNNNCTGAAGQNGCEGLMRVALPGSSGNCQGGPGTVDRLFAIFPLS
ncbi:MAG TPA: hypothetical protein VM241_05780 [Candidatus Thermoplasmatota archaeon]|nr:hypothetical protein [Candidatus Thermoplasmatota archaeon]